MTDDIRTNDQPGQDELRMVLESLRTALLALHKALVDSERVEYEKAFGKIQSPGHFLQLLTKDPWFAWLSPLSQLIVSIDECIDADTPLTTATVQALSRQAASLLTASESGAGFGKHYDEALQRDPDVVLAQSKVARLRGWREK